MKKLTTMIVAMALFFSASAFSNPLNGEDGFDAVFNTKNAKAVKAADVSNAVVRAFNEKYAGAESAEWKETESIYFVYFDMDDKPFAAAFSEYGDFIAVSRKISFDLLPIAAYEALTNKYNEYALSRSVTEIVMEGTTNYYLTAESKTHSLILQSSPDGYTNIFKKTKKKVLVGSVY